MNKAEIREFKGYVRDVLMNHYGMPELTAQRAIKNSYLSQALSRDPDYVEHDTVEEWAEFVYNEYHGVQLAEM